MPNPNKRIVILGGVAAGTKSAAKARRQDPHAEITLYTGEEYISYAGCGQPYYIGGEVQERAQLLARTPGQFQQGQNITIHTRHRATRIDPQAQTVDILDLAANQTRTVPYDALVIATGAAPIVPSLPGTDLPGVHVIRAMPAVDEIRRRLDQGSVQRAVVVGGGYIGLKMVENLVNRGVQVTVVEREKQLAPLYDADVAAHILRVLEQKGVRVMLGVSLEAIQGSPDRGVSSVTVAGQTIPADLVILSVGVRPETRLAQESGIEIGPTGAIRVNESMQTNFPNIYAAGDCVEVTNLVTGKPAWIPLGSTANKQGRVAGENITGGNAVFPGVTGTSIFRVFALNVAKTGLSEKEAQKEGFHYEAVVVPAEDKPHYMPGHKTVITKLIAERSTHRLLGAQVWGPGNVDKVIDTLATALFFKATVEDLTQLDLAYAPPFAPAMGNVITAANVLLNKLTKQTEGILPLEVMEKLDRQEDFIFLDVRDPQNIVMVCCESCLNIPAGQLELRCAELPKDKEIITTCMIGLNAAAAYRTLKRNGFQNVRYMDGGVTAWPRPKKKKQN
ncbi:MAG: FAD-dependent oxidoreductase [bacterium]